jgi:hypothetical protein
MKMNRTSKIILAVTLTLSTIGAVSGAAYYVQPTQVGPEAVDTDHYVQDLWALGIR